LPEAVSASPSGPPSSTFVPFRAQIVRRCSTIAPGTTASALVLTAQVDPTVVSAVAAQGAVTENVRSCWVTGAGPPPVGSGPSRPVIRRASDTDTSPV
jgi:hypothetical protein